MREGHARRFRGNLQERRQIEIQEEILRVAARLFAQHGYRAVTIDMISEDIGYSKSSIYYYFKSKDEILWRVFDSIYGTYLQAAERARDEESTPTGLMRRLIHQHILNVVDHHDWTTIYFHNETELPKDKQRLIRGRKRAYNQIYEDAYAAGVTAGSFRDLPPHIAVNAILGMCNSVFAWYDELRTSNIEEVIEHFQQLLANGYKKTGPPESTRTAGAESPPGPASVQT
jgi:AcrR family transcriptional regulator